MLKRLTWKLKIRDHQARTHCRAGQVRGTLLQAKANLKKTGRGDEMGGPTITNILSLYISARLSRRPTDQKNQELSIHLVGAGRRVQRTSHYNSKETAVPVKLQQDTKKRGINTTTSLRRSRILRGKTRCEKMYHQ